MVHDDNDAMMMTIVIMMITMMALMQDNVGGHLTMAMGQGRR